MERTRQRFLRLRALGCCALLLAGCAWVVPPPAACADESGWTPPPPLKCGEAVAAANAALPFAHPLIESVSFDWGEMSDCPPNGRCAATDPSHGVVTFHFRDAPDAYIEVSKEGSIVRATSELTPVEAGRYGD